MTNASTLLKTAFLQILIAIFLISCGERKPPDEMAKEEQNKFFRDDTTIAIPDSTKASEIAAPNNSGPPQFAVHMKLKIMDADSTGGIVRIKKAGGTYNEIKLPGNDPVVRFDLNSYYFVECSKKGFATKVVYIDTKIPEGREKDNFAKFIMTVELYRSEKDKRPDVVKPVGGIKYMEAEGDFNKVEN